MLEGLLVLSLVTLLVGLGVCVLVVPASILFVVGLGGVAAGFGLGVPAGAYYHLKLYRLLRLRGPVPREFWLRPTRYHDQLDAAEWRTVFPWFAVGGGGFVLIILGSVIVALAILKA